MHRSVEDSVEYGEVYVRGYWWEWRTTLVRSLPEGTIDTVYLWLHDPAEGQNRMMVRLPPDIGELTTAEVAELAKFPDERWILTPSGAVLTMVPLRREPAKIRVSVVGEITRYIDLPEGITLGEATVLDILESVH